MNRFTTSLATDPLDPASASGAQKTLQQQGQNNSKPTNSMATSTTFTQPQHQSTKLPHAARGQGFGRQAISCSYKSHSAQNASSDIKDVSSSKKNSMDSQVNSLCRALAQGVDTWPPLTNYGNASITRTLEPKIRPTTLEDLIADMSQMKLEFDKRLSQVVRDYEATRAIVRRLYSDLEKKQDEINVLQTKYEISVNENALLYDALNNEMAHLSSLASTSPLGSDGQWRKKMDTTLKERNQWHQTACLLARELQDVTIYFDSNTSNTYQSDDDANFGLTTTTTKTNSHSIATTSSNSNTLNRES